MKRHITNGNYLSDSASNIVKFRAWRLKSLLAETEAVFRGTDPRNLIKSLKTLVGIINYK